MFVIGDECWRDSYGNPHFTLPWRVIMPDGSTRTDPEQWSKDNTVLNAMGWTRSIITQQDIDTIIPVEQPQDPISAGWETPEGWRLSWQPNDVALLTGLYVLARRAAELGIEQPCIVTDMDGVQHNLNLETFEQLMLEYGAARAALSARVIHE